MISSKQFDGENSGFGIEGEHVASKFNPFSDATERAFQTAKVAIM